MELSLVIQFTIIYLVKLRKLMSSIQYEVELENIRNSHVKDGVAFTKFMY
ncbi:xaa-Pro aminopeptidase domain protein [Clostridioides difficile DA00165]|nr:xaa-Pro aminopeptidase domain protein [Clostridioides difficile DA00165]